MRIDKYLSHSTHYSRKQIKLAIRAGEAAINGVGCKDAAYKVQQNDQVSFQGKVIEPPGHRYFLLNKPPGYCCSHEDDGYPSIFHLLPLTPEKLHIAGRLDADTTGLLLISSDGQWCHRITSPKQQHRKNKVYSVELTESLSEEDRLQLEKGVLLHGESTRTLPAQIQMQEQNRCTITIQEGRYHQIKRMFASVDNKVLSLHRLQVGAIRLDETLAEGDYRVLTEDEIRCFMPEGDKGEQ